MTITEIRSIFKQYRKKENMKFNEQELQKFLEFLEVDFYDWVKAGKAAAKK